MQLDIQSLLDGFEAPAVFYRENTVRYFNGAAKALFPEIQSGKGMPERFNDPDFPFRAEANQTGRGILYLFRPRLEERAEGDQACVSQELRQCLSGLTLALEELAPLVHQYGEERAEQVLSTAVHNLYRLRRLTDHSDLLRQMEARAPGLYRESALDLAGLCRELGEHVADLAAQAGVRFRLELKEQTVPTRGDGALLRRALLNLISNAMKAAEGEVGLRLEKRGDRALIAVWDNGRGMETERLAAVFRPQRRRRLTRPEDGAGMGLRIVRETVVLHGGIILAEGRPEGGVRMTVSLPLRPSGSGSFRSEAAWGEDGFDLVLTELSDALPSRLYNAENIDE